MIIILPNLEKKELFGINKMVYLMKKRYVTWELLIVLLGMFLITSCSDKNRTINISFTMINVKSYNPSYQMVIWLEKPDGTFFKTLFVTDYLAMGGYLEYGVCPRWSKKANWNEVTKEEFDAVTGATPAPGNVKMKIKTDDVPNGKYFLYLQVHLKEDLNDTYRGEVDFSGRKKAHVQMKPYKTNNTKDGERQSIISNIRVTIK